MEGGYGREEKELLHLHTNMVCSPTLPFHHLARAMWENTLAVMNDTKQDDFCSHCGSYRVRRLDTASVSYHRFLCGDTCILSMSPTQPFRLSAKGWEEVAFRGRVRSKTSDS